MVPWSAPVDGWSPTEAPPLPPLTRPKPEMDPRLVTSRPAGPLSGLLVGILVVLGVGLAISLWMTGQPAGDAWAVVESVGPDGAVVEVEYPDSDTRRWGNVTLGDPALPGDRVRVDLGGACRCEPRAPTYDDGTAIAFITTSALGLLLGIATGVATGVRYHRRRRAVDRAWTAATAPQWTVPIALAPVWVGRRRRHLAIDIWERPTGIPVGRVHLGQFLTDLDLTAPFVLVGRGDDVVALVSDDGGQIALPRTPLEPAVTAAGTGDARSDLAVEVARWGPTRHDGAWDRANGVHVRRASGVLFVVMVVVAVVGVSAVAGSPLTGNPLVGIVLSWVFGTIVARGFGIWARAAHRATLRRHHPASWKEADAAVRIVLRNRRPVPPNRRRPSVATR